MISICQLSLPAKSKTLWNTIPWCITVILRFLFPAASASAVHSEIPVTPVRTCSDLSVVVLSRVIAALVARYRFLMLHVAFMAATALSWMWILKDFSVVWTPRILSIEILVLFVAVCQAVRLGTDQSSKAAFGKSAFAKTCSNVLSFVEDMTGAH